jgi:hypothetical protein
MTFDPERMRTVQLVSRDKRQAAHVLHFVAVSPRIDCGVQPEVRDLDVPLVGAA